METESAITGLAGVPSTAVNPPATEIPASASSFLLNVIALLIGLVGIAASERLWPGNSGRAILAAGGAVAFTIALVEALTIGVATRSSTGLVAQALRPALWGEAALRCLGLAVTLGVVALIYWLLPEYHGSFYAPYWRFLRAIGWPALGLAPLYFVWAGRRVTAPNDAYLQLGRLAVGQGWREVDRDLLRAHFMGWTVKAFFLPLMVVYLDGEIGAVLGAFHELSWETMRLYRFFYELSFLIDLLFCVVGYTLTLRVLDSHIRSTEPTALGWIVALVCYQPFYSVIGNMYLNYESSLYWDTWLAPYPQVRAAWAIAIVLLLLVYGLSTVAFGLRFSNLTHRGIITSGPYRFTKHPAYVSKNLSWWLICVPFVAHSGWLDSLRHCALLGALNFIYFLRARTEERHLSRDPTYVAYALWMRDHGIFRWLKHIPRLALVRAGAGRSGIA
jgi:hypothetical protein